MFKQRLILEFIFVVLGVWVCQSVRIYTGPTDTTQEVGSKFKLKCVVVEKSAADSVIWHRVTEGATSPSLLAIDKIKKYPDLYDLDTDENSFYDLVVKNATVLDDAVFQCEAGSTKKAARVFVYDKPEGIILDWEHSVNRVGAVSANQEYKLRCKTTNSYPPATHRYYKDGVELSNAGISYTYHNSSSYVTGYSDVTSTLPFTPSKEDTEKRSKVMCVADLYTYRAAATASFSINTAAKESVVEMVMLLTSLAWVTFLFA